MAIAVAIAAFGGWYYWHTHRPAPPPAVVAAAPAAATTADDVIEHPVPAGGPATAPLPELADSDLALSAALGEAAGGVTHYLVPDNIVRHIVVTVDNLPRQKVAVDKRPITPTAGAFTADGDELHGTLQSENFQRYQPLVSLLQQTDMQRLAAVYLRFYPLFQKAYQDLVIRTATSMTGWCK